MEKLLQLVEYATKQVCSGKAREQIGRVVESALDNGNYLALAAF